MRACSVIRSRIRSAGSGEDPGADLLERQLEDVRLGDAGPGDHPDDRAERPLVELEGQGDPVDLEDDAGLVDLGGELVGEVGDQVLGQPGVDLLVGEDRLPGRLVADVVAELEALRHEPLGLDLRCVAGDLDHRAVKLGLVSQREPGHARDVARSSIRQDPDDRALACSVLRIERPSSWTREREGVESRSTLGMMREPNRWCGDRDELERGASPREAYDSGILRVNPKRGQAGPLAFAVAGGRRSCGSSAAHAPAYCSIGTAGPYSGEEKPAGGVPASCLLAWSAVAILLYWVVAASSLIRRDLLPELGFVRPPDLRSIARRRGATRPSRWVVQVIDDPAQPENRRPVGEAVTQSIHRDRRLGPHRRARSGSTRGGLLRGTPFASAGRRPSSRSPATTMIDPSGNLQSFRATVRSADPDMDELLRVEGRLKQAMPSRSPRAAPCRS